MMYLAMAFSVLWLSHFVYVVLLDSQLRDVRRRLDARTGGQD